MKQGYPYIPIADHLAIDLVFLELQPPARRRGLHHPCSRILPGITCPGCPIHDMVLKCKPCHTAQNLTAQI